MNCMLIAVESQIPDTNLPCAGPRREGRWSQSLSAPGQARIMQRQSACCELQEKQGNYSSSYKMGGLPS